MKSVSFAEGMVAIAARHVDNGTWLEIYRLHEVLRNDMLFHSTSFSQLC